MTVDVRRQRLVYEGFTSPELRGAFTPDRVAIEKRDDEVVAERIAPREAFADHGPDTPWDQLHALYFAGYAMWNYLTAPYLLTRPGIALDEVEPWQENGAPRTSPNSTSRHRDWSSPPTGTSCPPREADALSRNRS
ncbi:hypothetical protein [Streptomyces sp. NPDC058694]|uniref:hypothetical protein n=1 Tax=Streptomyces sp. NPDC058694 TaxID=3346603 RepID=UPI0036483F16